MVRPPLLLLVLVEELPVPSFEKGLLQGLNVLHPWALCAATEATNMPWLLMPSISRGSFVTLASVIVTGHWNHLPFFFPASWHRRARTE